LDEDFWLKSHGDLPFMKTQSAVSWEAGDFVSLKMMEY